MRWTLASGLCTMTRPMIPLHDDNPTTITPFITIGVIVICVLVFLWQLGQGPGTQQQVIVSLGLIPAVLFGHAQLAPEIVRVAPAATLLTSMFMHGGWLHLLGNMLYLWIFGNNVEDAMGHKRFLLFYLLCGLAAAMAQALPDPNSTIPMVGASGAISGVLGAYLLLYPKASVLVLIPLGFITQLVRLKAVWVLGLWFAIQLLSGLASAGGQGGVAFGAHIGGFLAGLALIPWFRHRHLPLYNPLRR